MLVGILGLLWELLKLPVRLVMLPFEILSFIISVIIYGSILLVLGALVFLFVL